MNVPKVGDKFRFKEGITCNSPDDTNAGWVTGVFEHLVEERTELKFVGVSSQGSWDMASASERVWCYSPSWLEPFDAAPVVVTPTCTCPSLLGGCTCGAMVAEQAAKGLTKDRWSGLWVKVQA